MVFALVLSSCAKTKPSPDANVREYLRLAVALGERDPDALDYYYGPADLVADIRTKPPTLPQITKSAQELLPKVSDNRFLTAQLKAIIARTGFIAGTRHPFDKESVEFFGFQAAPVDDKSFDATRKRIAELLPGSKPIAERFAAFDAKYMIPPEHEEAVLKKALEVCRAQTMTHMKLPAGEHIDLEFVHLKPWSAYSYYHGNYKSLIQVNADFGLTVDRALDLGCHEGYPGHHVFNSLTDEYQVRGKHRLEFFAQPTFSPQSLISEAAATVAPDIAFPGPERARIEREVLFPLAGLKPDNVDKYIEVERLMASLGPEELSVARDYIDDKLEFIRAADALDSKALMAHAEATIRYLNEYRTYVITYTAGHSAMSHWIFSKPDPWEALRSLIVEPGHFGDGIFVAGY